MDTAKRILDSLAAALVEAEPGDPESIGAVLTRLGELCANLSDSELATEAQACQASLTAANAAPERIAPTLERLTILVSNLQKPVTPTSASELVDNKLLGEFFGGQREANEQLEADVLAMERGESGRLDAIRRRLHNLKGEAGALGLMDLAKAYHAVEDLIHSPPDTAGTASALLAFKDWVDRVGIAYVQGCPAPPVGAILETLQLAARPQLGADASARTPDGAGPLTSNEGGSKIGTAAGPAAVDGLVQASSDARVATSGNGGLQGGRDMEHSARSDPRHEARKLPAVSTPAVGDKGNFAANRARERVERTEDTIALLTEFIHESEEGLSNADQILMNAEGAGSDAQAVRGLFGVFHTIKGVAGFLDLHEIAELAHATENVLAACRDGKMSLAGPALNIVFDATAAMRTMVRDVQAAVEHRGNIPTCAEAAQVVEHLRALLATVVTVSKRPGIKRTSVVPRSKEGVVAQHAPPTMTASEPQSAAAVPPEATPEQRASQAPAVKLRETVKVDVERIDGLIEMIGELVIAESMVSNAPDLTRSASPRLRNALAQLKKITRDLQDAGLRMRMVTLQGIFRKMARLVRDLGQKTGKLVRIDLSGEATEMDRSMVEQISDPLLHIIRNAVDHGIEYPDRRTAVGKPEVGTIGLSAYHEGGSIVIQIADDGLGLDRDAILAKARNVGIISPQAELSDSDIYALIFAPGFSTAAAVTEISGRGVGMDVVKRNVEAMRGRVVVQTERGKGTTFKIYLPLTLAIIDGTLIACGAEQYIVPTLSIVESVKPTPEMVLTVGGRNEMLNLRGKILPLQRLDRLFEVPDARQDACDQLVVVVESSIGKIGILVDEVITQQHVVIKSLGAGLGATPFASGAAILADGRIGLILNIEELCQTALGRTFGAAGIPRRGTDGGAPCNRVAH